jgi:hypothetical protein
MSAIEQIRNLILQEVFDYTQLIFALSSYQKPRDCITLMLKKNQIIRVRKGLYIFGPLWRRQPISYETIANLVFGPSVLSLDYVLSLYGLIPEHVSQFTSVTPARSRTYYTPIGHFSYQTLPQGLYQQGISVFTDAAGKHLIKEPIAALCDKIWIDNRFKPTSYASYSNYLFDDLRIDENILSKYWVESSSEEYTQLLPRKIEWFNQFMHKKFDS